MSKLILLGMGVGLFGAAAFVALAEPPAAPPSEVVGTIHLPDGLPGLPAWIRGREPLPAMPFPPPPPPPPKGAFFHLRRGDVEITVKCADDELIKACVEAASQLLDKVTTSN